MATERPRKIKTRLADKSKQPTKTIPVHELCNLPPDYKWEFCRSGCHMAYAHGIPRPPSPEDLQINKFMTFVKCLICYLVLGGHILNQTTIHLLPLNWFLVVPSRWNI